MAAPYVKKGITVASPYVKAGAGVVQDVAKPVIKAAGPVVQVNWRFGYLCIRKQRCVPWELCLEARSNLNPCGGEIFSI